MPRTLDSSTWDPNHPVFEYDNVNVADWDSTHPNNPTRYLRPDFGKFFKITGSTQNVTIDPVPPKFVSDIGTEYLTTEADINGKLKTINGIVYQYSTATRTIAIEFNDEIGLDFKQFALVRYNDIDITDWGNIKELTDNIIYYYDRSLDKPLQQNYVDKVNFYSTTTGNYKVKFELNECWGELDELSGEITNKKYLVDLINSSFTETVVHGIAKKKYVKSCISLIVWDLAGNYTVYSFKKPFNSIGIEDLNGLVPVNITFTNIEPQNYYLEDGIEGKILTNVFNPNEILWEFPNVAGLLEDSIGQIDLSSYEAGDNTKIHPLAGIREFYITNLTESGNVMVEAWVSLEEDSEIAELVKEKTYNSAICGPWIYGDEGRKYHITPYVPKYLQGTEFYSFVEYFQLFINTLYKGLDRNRNISILEKIARIGNFNDISRLEDALIFHYAKEFGNEFDFNVDSLKNVNLIQTGTGFTTKDYSDTFDTIKYVLEQLPIYNQYKGTDTGIMFGIKMFGFTSRVINIWVKKKNEIEENPEFIDEDRLHSFEDYFMTSRFNMEVDSGDNTFKTFNDNIEMFIELVKSIKPLTRILNEIKYTIVKNQILNIAYQCEEVVVDTEETEYSLEWNFDIYHKKNILNFERICKLDKKTNTLDLICLDYLPTNLYDSTDSSSKYIPIAKFLKSKFDKIVLNVESTEQEPTRYEFPYDEVVPVINSGTFYILLKDSASTTGGLLYKKYFDFKKLYSGDDSVSIKLNFKIQAGTDFAVSL